MSLAMYAAPFDNEPNQIVNNDTTNHIGKKRIALNKTQKRYPNNNNNNNVNTEKVLSVIQSIHNLPEQQSELADFSPIPPPTSMGVQATISREGSKNLDSPLESNIGNSYSENANQSMSEDFYKRFIPNYESMYSSVPDNMPSYKFSNTTASMATPTSKNFANPSFHSGSTNDLLIEKLNYMIHLLEEQQDERTSNVTEEVILYSFLGIFIIFIVDSFARVGKYTR
jgi:hypothetical protein